METCELNLQPECYFEQPSCIYMYILPLCSHIIHQTHPHTLVVYLIWKVSHLSL